MQVLNFSRKMSPFYLVFLVITTGLAACRPDKSTLIEERVGERVNAFRAREEALCRENLYAEAEKIVDSLLLLEAQQSLRDSMLKIRPVKPFRPAGVPPIDSAEIKPLFDQ